jgi:hypothetical protein
MDVAEVGRAVRALRGERTRAEFIREVYDTTGEYMRDPALYRIEAGRYAGYVLPEAHALMIAYPQLAPLFLGRKLYERIVNHQSTL